MEIAKRERSSSWGVIFGFYSNRANQNILVGFYLNISGDCKVGFLGCWSVALVLRFFLRPTIFNKFYSLVLIN